LIIQVDAAKPMQNIPQNGLSIRIGLHFREERVIDFRVAYTRAFYKPFVTVERPEVICISPRCEIQRKRSSFRSAGVRINLSARCEHQIPELPSFRAAAAKF